MAEQSSNIERQAESRQMPEGDLATKKVEATAQSAAHTAKTTKKDDGNPGEAREDPSVPTWTDKKTVRAAACPVSSFSASANSNARGPSTSRAMRPSPATR